MSDRRRLLPEAIAELQTEMRRILPQSPVSPQSQSFRDVRRVNQDRFDAAMQARQRPSRVS
jgi:hypothetical protein